MVITVGGFKGGTGKTTIATNLVIMLAKRGEEVLFVDADEQESATAFSALRQENLKFTGYTAIKLTGKTIYAQIADLKTKYKHIVIDAGGRDTTGQRSAVAASDVYLLPFKPRSLDLWTVEDINELITQVRAAKAGKLLVIAFLNQADISGGNNAKAGEALQDWEGIDFIKPKVSNRIAFAKAVGEGLSVIELKPQDEKATFEIQTLFETILTHVKSVENAVQEATN